MTMIRAIAISFSMFSVIPMPRVEWNAKNMRYSLCVFPLIGGVIGGLCWLWIYLCDLLSLPVFLKGAGLCAIPVLLTGGIHLDGFADTHDALASHADPEKRREILKDPHTGAFATIRVCLYFILAFSIWVSLPDWNGISVILMFCLSRTLSGLALVFFPLAEEGLARTFADAADKKKVRTVLIALTAVLCAGLIFAKGVLLIPAAAAVFCMYYWMVRKRFGGTSGDLAGWFLQTAELWMLAALFLTGYLEAMIGWCL